MPTREIMFRGLAEDGKWLYGGYVRDRGVDRIFPENYELNGTAVKAGTVGEYSGFSDNEGTMIFEGDMLRVEKDSNNSVFTTTGIVEFDRGVFMLRTTTGNTPLYQILTLDASVTILGNEVTDKKKVLLQRINEFLDSCIPDFTDDMTEQQEMYGIIKQAKELLEGEQE